MRSSHKMLMVVVGVLFLAACGGGQKRPGVASVDKSAANRGPSATANAGGDPQQQRLAWAKCMRDNGLDVPDPKPNEGLALPGNPSDPKIQKAMDGCKQYLAGAQTKVDGADDPAFKEKLAGYAKCMREHGVDMPDPNGGGVQRIPSMSDPKAADAAKACASLAPGR